jgi:drug/metabolite transporter (DMT)-like permease
MLKPNDLGELILLAALWGASFLFMRMGAAEFGPVALAAVRVGGATLFLMPLLAARGQAGALVRRWRGIVAVGIVNSALPFLCYSYAALSITAGLSSIFNAAAPLFGAVVAAFWLRERLTASRIVGLVIGFSGVLWLAWDRASFKPGGSGFAIVACLAATLCYGFGASLTKKVLAGVPPLAVAAGSQLGAAIVLAVPAFVWWPASAPTPTAWIAAALLAVACTGIAYVLYFRLIAQVGPTNAITVTFLIPAFAVLWGHLFLDEAFTPQMVIGCVVILVGTALTTGVLKLPSRKAVRA